MYTNSFPFPFLTPVFNCLMIYQSRFSYRKQNSLSLVLGGRDFVQNIEGLKNFRKSWRDRCYAKLPQNELQISCMGQPGQGTTVKKKKKKKKKRKEKEEKEKKRRRDLRSWSKLFAMNWSLIKYMDWYNCFMLLLAGRGVTELWP